MEKLHVPLPVALELVLNMAESTYCKCPKPLMTPKEYESLKVVKRLLKEMKK